MTGNPPTVFIVDDDDDVRIALSRSLQKRGMTVAHFASAREFLDRVDENDNGCLILDYGMPGMDGLELQDLLIAQKSAIPIIFISGHGGIPESVRATKAGAIDFLEKPFSLKILTERINTAFEIGVKQQSEKLRRSALVARYNDLTIREEEVLRHILEYPSRISSKEIASSLGISPRTVDIHRGRVLQKMDAKSVTELFKLCSNVVGQAKS